MQPLQTVQMWEMMQSRQAEMRKEAKMAHLASLAEKQQEGWWSSLFRRQMQAPTLALEPSATPKLG